MTKVSHIAGDGSGKIMSKGFCLSQSPRLPNGKLEQVAFDLNRCAVEIKRVNPPYIK